MKCAPERGHRVPRSGPGRHGVTVTPCKEAMMTELELLVDLHRHTPRQGPGSREETLRALACIDLPAGQALKIADLGCGSGAQTLDLAEKLPGQIVAVDLFEPFLEELQEAAGKAKRSAQIETLAASMDDLPFQPDEFDIIWSEGAIYNIGFENGVRSWRPYLKPGGYLAVSEITWLTPTRPAEIEAYWQAAYPEIDTAANKMKILEDNGYSPVGYLILSSRSWLDNYYQPLQAHLAAFLDRHEHSALATSIVAEQQQEIALYEKYQAYYSYGFYVARKVG